MEPRRRQVQLGGTLITAVTVVLSTSLSPGQTPADTAPKAGGRFEVASVRRNTAGAERWRTAMFLRQPGGVLRVTAVPLRDLIRVAFGVGQFEPVEGASRALEERYNIDAVLVGRPTNPAPALFDSALKDLLTERFRLVVHREARHVEGLALIAENVHDAPSSHIRRSSLNCAELRASGTTAPRDADGRDPCNMSGVPAAPSDPAQGLRVRAGGHTIREFASSLQFQLRMPVSDQTGVTGTYVLDVTYRLPPLGGSAVDAVDGIADLDDALRTQLGMRLKRVKVDVNALVVDQISELEPN